MKPRAGLYAEFGKPYWLDFKRPRFGALEADASAPVVIIGAGIAGLKLAHNLAKLDVNTIVLEDGIVGDGASGRNQGSMNHGTSVSYAECAAKYGRDNARDLWRLGLENQKLACEQIREYNIECSYTALGFTFMARTDQPGCEATLEGYRADHALLVEDGFDAELLDTNALRSDGQHPFFVGGLRFPTDSQFHSGRYVAGLASGVARSPRVRIFDQTRALKIDSDGANAVCVNTARGNVRAEHAFLVTNALAPQFVRSLAPAIRAERGQVIVTEPLAQRPCTGSFGAAMAWWREIPEPDGKWRLLFGGGRKRDEPDSLFFQQYDAQGKPDPSLETEGFSHSDAHQRRLDEQFALLFPRLQGSRITHRWGGLQAFTADSLPMIGDFDPSRRLHGMAGFCGRGNAHTDVGAQFLAGQIAGVVSPIEQRFGKMIRELLTPTRLETHW